MKIPIAISLLILAVAALIGWRDHHELAGLRAENFRLRGEAAMMGITLDEPSEAQRRTKSERSDKLAVAHQTALDIIVLAKELERLRESGDPTDAAMQDRILEALEILGSLNTEQLKAMIEVFREDEGLTDGSRWMLISVSLKALSERNPKVALDLLVGQVNTFGDVRGRSALISSSISKWSETDPSGALAWVRASSPDLMGHEPMEAALVHGAARTDLRLALGMIREFGISDISGVVTKIAGDLRTPGERANLLRLMKEQPETFGQKEINGTLVTMGREIGKSGYEEGTRWIKENGFSESEIMNLIGGGMVSHAKGSDTGRWVEWMGENLSEERREHFIGRNVTDWTRKDHRAAGQWLAALPDCPAKPPAVAAFAKTVAPYDPEIATEWAMTLPPGNQRDVILKEVARIREEKAAE